MEYTEMSGHVEVVGAQTLSSSTVSAEWQRNNVFFREKNVTYAYIYDFLELDRFWINTPTFKFDSHDAEYRGWHLKVTQRHFQGIPKKMTVMLVHGGTNSKIFIRPSSEFRSRSIKHPSDVVDMFKCGRFTLEHAVTVFQRRVDPKVRSIESYSDEELLQILHSRTMSRVGGYRGPKPAPIDLSNVIDLDQIRQIKFDETIVENLLAA